MSSAEFDLCNQAQRALVEELKRALRGYIDHTGVDALALAMLDFDGVPLDADGSFTLEVPDHLIWLVSRRQDVRAWAPKAPPRSLAMFEMITIYTS